MMKEILKDDKFDLYHKLFGEYCQLATCPQLGEAQADRMIEILEKSQNDTILNFLITEADHIVAHQLGLMEENNQQSIREWQYCLDRMVFFDRPETMEVLMAQLYDFFVTQQLQCRLQEEGFDPGPIDGVLGQRTEAAVKAFQTAKGMSDRDLDATDPKLLAALGLS